MDKRKGKSETKGEEAEERESMSGCHQTRFAARRERTWLVPQGRRSVGSELPPRWKLDQDHLREYKVYFCFLCVCSAYVCVCVSLRLHLWQVVNHATEERKVRGNSGGGS